MDIKRKKTRLKIIFGKIITQGIEIAGKNKETRV